MKGFQRGDIVLVRLLHGFVFRAVVWESMKGQVTVLTEQGAHRYRLGEATLTLERRCGKEADVPALARGLQGGKEVQWRSER